MNAHPDQRYVDALINNDAGLLKELYQKHAGKIRSMVLTNNGTEADAGDIFQEALIAVYQKARQGNFILTCPLDAYLYMICKNRWINELNRKTGKTVTFVDTEGYNYSEDSFNSAEIIIQQNDRRNLLQEKIKELGEGCQQVLKLSWSGLSMGQVAKQLQNSYGYIRKKKSECMAKLIALVKASPKFVKLQW